MDKLDRKLKTIVAIWFPLAVSITLICVLIYLVAQQTIRLSANSHQTEIARDYAAILTNGQDIKPLIPKRQIDISQSLKTYVIIFDSNANLLFSSAFIDGKTPLPPKSVFDYVKTAGETKITWQPKPGVRSAIVIDRFEGLHPGYILVGKSLKETELLEDRIFSIVSLAWIASVAISFLAVAFSLKLASKK